MTAVSKDKIKDSVKAFQALDAIFGDIKKKPVLESAPQQPNSPNIDIRGVELSDSLVESILEFKNPNHKPKPVVKKEIKKVIETDSKDRLQDLIGKLTTLLQEAKQVIAEMTTAGMIGTNQKFTLGQKKKNKYEKFGLKLKSLRK